MNTEEIDARKVRRFAEPGLADVMTCAQVSFIPSKNTVKADRQISPHKRAMASGPQPPNTALLKAAPWAFDRHNPVPAQGRL